MVDLRPILFINFLMLLTLASVGLSHLLKDQEQEQAIIEASADTPQERLPESVADNNSSPSSSETRQDAPVTPPAVVEEEAPIFADQVAPDTSSSRTQASEPTVTTEPEIPAAVVQQTEPSTPPVSEVATPAPANTTGKLTVRSNVYGDTVLINGKPYGASALEIDLTPGTYDVEVTKSGYQAWRQSIYIARGGNQTIVAKLNKLTTVNFRNDKWENGIKTGEGRYQDGARVDYQGSFVNGQFHGFGSVRYGDGSRYQGEWFEGSRKGQGTFVASNGDTFVGQFSDDQFNGDGTLTKSNGDIYTGYWIDGELNGQGSLTTRDGMLYVGGFSDNLFHGSGTLTYPDGGTYEGSFSNGLYHGKGVEIYANGKKYEGQFIEGLYHGKGEIQNPNGSKISGTFKDGEPFGKVTLTTAEGEVFTARSSEPGICYRPKSYRATECPKLDGW